MAGAGGDQPAGQAKNARGGIVEFGADTPTYYDADWPRR